jgi:hypothetical protein
VTNLITPLLAGDTAEFIRENPDDLAILIDVREKEWR